MVSDEVLRALIAVAEDTIGFLENIEWLDRTTETDAANLAQALQEVIIEAESSLLATDATLPELPTEQARASKSD